MLADSSKLIPANRLKGPEANQFILEVLNFVETRLVEFSERFSSISPEKGLTFQLVNLLQRDTYIEPCPFWFHPGYLEEPDRGNSREPDLGVMPKESNTIIVNGKSFPYNRSFFSFEAKILPSPETSREREYLIGREIRGKYKACGGVERFKKELHGKGLDFSGILGYVKQEDFAYWQLTINSWIDELINDPKDHLLKWDDNDKLSKQHARPITARYISYNKRSQDTITLFHLWVKLHS